MKLLQYKLLLAASILLLAFAPKNIDGISVRKSMVSPLKENEELKLKTLKILENKCNTCHKHQNPLMIFKPKNMEKRAKKIYEMVFIQKRMPRGDKVKLNKQEYETLEKWLLTQNI